MEQIMTEQLHEIVAVGGTNLWKWLGIGLSSVELLNLVVISPLIMTVGFVEVIKDIMAAGTIVKADILNLVYLTYFALYWASLGGI